MKLDRLEVTIKQKRSRFTATSLLFPTCKGIGSTETLALKQLSGSIARYIAKFATASLEKILTSEDYTELISPLPTAADDCQTKRIYSVENPLFFSDSSCSKKSDLSPLPYSIDDLVEDNVRELIQSEIDMVLEGGPGLLGRSSYRQDDDGAFGILMSLN